MNQLNFRNKLINENDVQNILNKGGIDLKIKNIELFRRAFTHKSYIKIDNTNISYNEILMDDNIVDLQELSNERFEFLGDTIIGHTICEYLYNRYPDKDEGFMTRLKTKLVDRKRLAILSRYLNLQEYILMSNHMENIHGRNTDKILEDIFESFICAMNLEFGFEVCRKFIINIIEKNINFTQLLYLDENYKDRLMQFLQHRGYPTPTYTKLVVLGPTNKRTFIMQVWMKTTKKNDESKDDKQKLIGTGIGKSKKSAEQIASRNALKKFGQLKFYELKEYEITRKN